MIPFKDILGFLGHEIFHWPNKQDEEAQGICCITRAKPKKTIKGAYQNNTPLETKTHPLKRNDAWKTTFPFWVSVNFQGCELLNIFGGGT